MAHKRIQVLQHPPRAVENRTNTRHILSHIPSGRPGIQPRTLLHRPPQLPRRVHQTTPLPLNSLIHEPIQPLKLFEHEILGRGLVGGTPRFPAAQALLHQAHDVRRRDDRSDAHHAQNTLDVEVTVAERLEGRLDQEVVNFDAPPAATRQSPRRASPALCIHRNSKILYIQINLLARRPTSESPARSGVGIPTWDGQTNPCPRRQEPALYHGCAASRVSIHGTERIEYATMANGWPSGATTGSVIGGFARASVGRVPRGHGTWDIPFFVFPPLVHRRHMPRW